MSGLKRLRAGTPDGSILPVRPFLRSILWAFLLALTGVLLLYPKHLTLEYNPVESVRVFPNLITFGVLFYAWIILLISLIFLPSTNRLGSWQALILALVFVLIFRGLFDTYAPVQGQDSLSNVISIQTIGSSGRLPYGNPNVVYWEYPGLHILTVTVFQLLNVGVYQASRLMLITLDIIIASVYFILFSRLLGYTPAASFGAVLAMMGNVNFALLTFYPGYLGLVFVGLFLMIFLQDHEWSKDQWQSIVSGLFILGAATVTHFVSSALLLMFLLGAYGVRMVTRQSRNVQERPGVLAYLVYGTFPLIWLLLWGVVTFSNLVRQAAAFGITYFRQIWEFILTVGGMNLGSEQPIWASITILIWLLLIFGAGTISVFVYPFRARGDNRLRIRASGAFIGVIVVSFGSLLLSGAGSEYGRYLAFAPFFTVPFLLNSVLELRPRLRNSALRVLAVLIITLSLPTLLAHNAHVAVKAFYPFEYKGGAFLSTYFQGKDPRIFSLGFSALPVQYAYPQARYSLLEDWPVIVSRNRRAAWSGMHAVISHFSGPVVRSQPRIFVISKRVYMFYRYLMGIAVSDPHWQVIIRMLSLKSATIYDNGSLRLFIAAQGAD